MSDEHDPETRWDLAQPIDMTEVHADDQFLEALSADRPVHTRDDTEYQLAELLSGWRHDVVAEPAPQMPGVDEVQAAIAATERARRSRGVVRHLRIASGVAAIVVVAGAGLTVLSQNSSPGDPLWGVKRVVFAEAATQTQASMDVQSNLEKAEAAVAAGNTAEAQSLVAKAQQDLKPINDDDTRNRMNEWIARLKADVTNTATSTTAGEPSVTTTTGARPDRSKAPTSPPKDLLRPQLPGGLPSVTLPTIPVIPLPTIPGFPGSHPEQSTPGRGGNGPGNPDRRDMRAPTGQNPSQTTPTQQGPTQQSPTPPTNQPPTQQVPTTTTDVPTPATTFVPTSPAITGGGRGGNGDQHTRPQPYPDQQGPITTTPYPWLRPHRG